MPASRGKYGKTGVYNATPADLGDGESTSIAVNSHGEAITSTPDGNNAVEGTVADAAVSTDAAGTISAKLRGLVKILANVWDSVLHSLGVNMVTGLLYTNDSVIAHPPACEVTEVDLATDADVVVTANPAKLLGIYVSVVMSAHVAPIKDNATAKITLPASLAAGTYIPCNAATFSTNITVESDNAATGKILVFWLPLA